MKISELKNLLSSLQIKPQKKFGQNFLVQEKIADRIVSEAHLTKKIGVAEIGPGLGVLTERLLPVSREVIAVELDKRLAEFLKEKFSKEKKITIIQNDILEILPTDIPIKKPFKIIANLPYQITSHFFRLLFESEQKPEETIVMIQKEVAERILAQDKKMSLLSFFVQWYSAPAILFHVSGGNFWPVPQVESSVIRLTLYKNPREKWEVSVKEEQKIFSLVRIGFSQKRKQLANLLGAQYGREYIEVQLKKIGILKTIRAEDLSIQDWIQLAREL